jgi:hypothetical protein
MVGQFAEGHGRHQNCNGRYYKDHRRCRCIYLWGNARTEGVVF